jgi:hypothetical protein
MPFLQVHGGQWIDMQDLLGLSTSAVVECRTFSFVAGQKVVLVKLRATEFNGCVGTVVETPDDSVRWNVMLPSGKQLSVKEDNLETAESHKHEKACGYCERKVALDVQLVMQR